MIKVIFVCIELLLCINTPIPGWRPFPLFKHIITNWIYQRLVILHISGGSMMGVKSATMHPLFELLGKPSLHRRDSLGDFCRFFVNHIHFWHSARETLISHGDRKGAVGLCQLKDISSGSLGCWRKVKAARSPANCAVSRIVTHQKGMLALLMTGWRLHSLT